MRMLHLPENALQGKYLYKKPVGIDSVSGGYGNLGCLSRETLQKKGFRADSKALVQSEPNLSSLAPAPQINK